MIWALAPRATGRNLLSSIRASTFSFLIALMLSLAGTPPVPMLALALLLHAPAEALDRMSVNTNAEREDRRRGRSEAAINRAVQTSVSCRSRYGFFRRAAGRRGAAECNRLAPIQEKMMLAAVAVSAVPPKNYARFTPKQDRRSRSSC